MVVFNWELTENALEGDTLLESAMITNKAIICDRSWIFVAFSIFSMLLELHSDYRLRQVDCNF